MGAVSRNVRVCWRVLLIALVCQCAVHAQTPLQVKAAFLPKLAGFVTWPTNAFVSPQAPIIVGLLGEVPRGLGFRATLAKSVVGGRAIELRSLDALTEATNCHIVYVASEFKHDTGALLKIVAGYPVLTVADVAGFAQQGGIVNFIVRDGKVRFEINRTAAQKAGLTLDGRLLGVATLVGPKPNADERGEQP